MPELKLYYFHPGARALTSRLILAAANVDYDFVQVKRDDWRELKPTFLFGQLPVLTVDGKQYAQSLAIQAYLAREYGLYGSSNIEQLEIDQIVQLREDLSKETQRNRDRDPVKQAEREKHLTENVYPRYLELFSKTLKENGTGFAVGNKLSLADLVLYEATSPLTHTYAELLQNYPEIATHKEKIEQVPGIAEYLTNRGEATRV